MHLSCDACSFECHHNFNTQCRVQLKTAHSNNNQNLAATRANALIVWCLIWVPSQFQYAMSCTIDNSPFQHNQNLAVTRAVSMLLSCDASFEWHHNRLYIIRFALDDSTTFIGLLHEILAARTSNIVSALILLRCLSWVPSYLQYNGICYCWQLIWTSFVPHPPLDN